MALCNECNRTHDNIFLPLIIYSALVTGISDGRSLILFMIFLVLFSSNSRRRVQRMGALDSLYEKL